MSWNANLFQFSRSVLFGYEGRITAKKLNISTGLFSLRPALSLPSSRRYVRVISTSFCTLQDVTSEMNYPVISTLFCTLQDVTSEKNYPVTSTLFCTLQDVTSEMNYPVISTVFCTLQDVTSEKNYPVIRKVFLRI